MKAVLIILSVILTVTAKAQPKVVGDTLFIDSVKLVKGQTIQIGTGSNAATKGFNYLFTTPGLGVPVPLSAQWAGYKMQIKKFKQEGNSTMGYKYYVVLSAGAMINYWCDIVPALQSKEVLITNNDLTKTQ